MTELNASTAIDPGPGQMSVMGVHAVQPGTTTGFGSSGSGMTNFSNSEAFATWLYDADPLTVSEKILAEIAQRQNSEDTNSTVTEITTEMNGSTASNTFDTNGGFQNASFSTGPTYFQNSSGPPFVVGRGTVRSAPILSAPYIAKNIFAKPGYTFSLTTSGTATTGVGIGWVPANLNWDVFEAESGTWVAGGMVFVGSLNNPLSTPLQINFTSPGNYNFAFYPAPATGNQDVNVQLNLTSWGH